MNRVDTTLDRMLAGLERELFEASDEEILAAATELGMKPAMKGSAAFLGIKYGFGMFHPDDLYGVKRRAHLAAYAQELADFFPYLRPKAKQQRDR